MTSARLPQAEVKDLPDGLAGDSGPAPHEGAGAAGETPQPYNQVLSDILQRDWADSHRGRHLRQAEDALLLDTSHLDFDQSREALLHMIKERIGW